ncbi:unnamed protein product [Lymnaea stagnalis]|uniref:TIR domain-containing protein n=1 Tax=Lymnaea stagnalis TaxID=6523 RepID=A0AAV2H636_LYMST
MIQRKYVPMGISSAGIVFSLMFFTLPKYVYPYNPLFKYELNCSHLCTCRENPMESIMRQFNQKHFILMGEKYRPEINRFDSRSDYMGFLGIFAPILHRIADVSCILSDGQVHSVTSLLNGVDFYMYTALQVKCRKKEILIWDIPSWHTSFNIFASEHCTILPKEPVTRIIIPMNLWIADIEKGGPTVIEKLDLKFSMNTMSLVIVGSRITSPPKQWKDKYMLSASHLTLKENHIESYECDLLFTKRLDTLNLEGNHLTRFPECVLDPKNVKLNYLSLSLNHISDLTPILEAPDSSQVPDIFIINLSHNKIRSVESIRNMGRMHVLDLSNNDIREVSKDAFINLKNLKKLYLSNNRLQVLALHTFLANSKLELLDVSHNALVSINPENMPEDRAALELDVRDNKLIYPPWKECARNPITNARLRIVSGNNPYFCDCDMIDFEKCVKWLDNKTANGTSAETVFLDMNQMKCFGPPLVKGKEIKSLLFHTHCQIIDNCPHPCKCFLENLDTLRINCSSSKLLELPDALPTYPDARVVLYMDHNPLQMLSYRSYLSQLSELHMDNCLLMSVTPAAISALQNIRVLTLHNNLLQKLPSSTRNLTLNHATNVTLHNNRWSCSCESLWLPRWITKHKSSLWMPGNIVCDYLRKPVEELNEMDLNCKSSSYMDTFLAISLALSSVVSTLVIVFCYRSEITVLLYSKLGLRIGYSFSYGDCFNPYDAFVSYSQDNYRWVVDTLVPHLENGPRKYRLCLHYRDFPAGEPVVDNIPWAIRLSRCAILVLSKDFLKKEWCIMDVRAAFQRLLLVANRLIIIATDDINVEELSPDLRAYMNTHDYLRVGEPCFWDKLEMFLPPKKASGLEPESYATAMPGPGGEGGTTKMSDRNEDMIGTDVSDMSFQHGDSVLIRPR